MSPGLALILICRGASPWPDGTFTDGNAASLGLLRPGLISGMESQSMAAEEGSGQLVPRSPHALSPLQWVTALTEASLGGIQHLCPGQGDLYETSSGS